MKAISKAAVLASALVISAFVFGKILSSSAQTSGAAASGVDCSGIAPWAATTIYKPGDLLTHNSRLYKSLADIWNAPPDNPASAHWYQDVGECGDQPPDNRPPTGTLSAPATVDSGASATFSVSASDPDGDPLTYTWTRPAGFTGDAGSTTTVTLTAPSVTTDQQATINVVVADGRGGTIPLSETFTVKAGGSANRPPTATLEGPPTVNSGGNAMFIAIADDPDGDALTYTWTLPEGFTSGHINDNVASLWAPIVTADRQATVSVLVSDGRGGTVTATKTTTVKADTTSQPPTVVVTGPTTVEAGTEVMLDARGSTGNNPGGGPLDFLWTVPAGILPETATTPVFQFVAPMVTVSTPYVFTVRVDQGSAHASKSHTVTVTPKQGGGTCSVPNWQEGHAYEAGEQASNHGELYSCKEPGWCLQKPYEPGGTYHGDVIWPRAWDHDGKCDSGEPGNVLKLEFPSRPAYVSKQQRLRQAKPLSGVLRCGTDETQIGADWGETLSIRGLKACKYQLILNAAAESGHLPIRSPRVIEFKNEDGGTHTELLDYGQPIDLAQLKPLPGVKIEVFAHGLWEPRQMAMGNGVIYVGSGSMLYGAVPDVGTHLYALPLDETGKVRGIHVIASGLEEPHGVAYRNGDLYYSTSDGIYRMRGIDTAYANPPPAEKIRSFPSEESLFPILPEPPAWRRWHMKRPIMFNPVQPNDPWLYSMVGRVCNTCIIKPDPRYGTLIRYNVETGAEQVIAYGVRNAVGWDWDPRTGDIWWSDNNRQRLYNGDEINRLVKPGEGEIPHFGSPYMYANVLGFTQQEWSTPQKQLEATGYNAMGFTALPNGVILSDLGPDQIDPNHYEAPSFVMGSNSAPLGVKFWNGYRPQAGMQRLLFSTHGLGSSAREAGLEIRMLTIDGESKVVAETPLITGWQRTYGDGSRDCVRGCSGRPVEFLSMADGSLLISDDTQGVIYRVTYSPAGLPNTLLKLHAPAAPDESVAKEMVTGSLTDSAGVVRKLAVAWGSDALELAGLPAGEYTIRLDDVGDWRPEKRNIPVNLSGNSVVNFTYRPRGDEKGTITVQAPPQPNSRLIAQALHVRVVDEKGGAEVGQIDIPWGASGSVTVPSGDYEVLFPYVSPSFLPSPSSKNVSVEEDEPVEVAMHYIAVESLGREVLDSACSSCHDSKFFDDPDKANRYDLAGPEDLIRKIMSMGVAGHCDGVCASEVAAYLFDVTWHPYLKPEADSSTRQIRLLTRNEYRNSVQDVLGVSINEDLIPVDSIDSTFRYPGLADQGIVSQANVGMYYQVALQVAQQTNVQQLGYQSGGDNTAFIERVGRHLYRRRLNPAQSARLSTYLQEHGPDNLIAAMLVSPYFLYRTELGSPTEKGLSKLTRSEIATLLSFGFLGTTPSLELLDKAEAGQLDTPDEIASEFENMLQSEQGQAQFARFVSYYDRSYNTVGAKPGLDEATIASMRGELDAFARQLIANPSATMGELFNPGYTFLNERLAQHYGIPGVSGEAMQKVGVDAKRGGLLHMGILHASVSDDGATSLVKRGKMLREQMFCRGMGSAADGLDPDPVDYPARPYSTAEYWRLTTGEHASRGQCWQCHQYMNEGGISFEHYDQTGVYREIEKSFNSVGTVTINASGVLLNNTGGIWTTFDNVRDISEHIPSNPVAQDCLARSYYGYIQGEPVRGGARETVKAMTEELAGSGSLRKMLAALATSDALLYRKNED